MKRAIAMLMLALIAGAASAADPDKNHESSAMVHVSRSVMIDAAADIVWSTVRDYDSPGLWDPSVTSAIITHGRNNKPGAKRHMTLADGGTTDDTLTGWDADKRTFSTKITRTSLSVSRYHDRIAVEPARNGVRLSWTAWFKPASDKPKARQAMAHRIEAALKHVKAMLGTASEDSKTKTVLSPPHS